MSNKYNKTIKSWTNRYFENWIKIQIIWRYENATFQKQYLNLISYIKKTDLNIKEDCKFNIWKSNVIYIHVIWWRFYWYSEKIKIIEFDFNFPIHMPPYRLFLIPKYRRYCKMNVCRHLLRFWEGIARDLHMRSNKDRCQYRHPYLYAFLKKHCNPLCIPYSKMAPYNHRFCRR